MAILFFKLVLRYTAHIQLFTCNFWDSIDLIHKRQFWDYVINFRMPNSKRREGRSVLQPDCCEQWQKRKSTVRIPMMQKRS